MTGDIRALPHALEIIETEADENRSAILMLLRQYNESRAGSPAAMPLSILLRNTDGRIIGGLHGTSAYDWLIVELLFVPEPLRSEGVGTSLLLRAEDVARDRGCLGVWLDTFSFQARGFYERLGYGVFGAVEDHPADGARYFLKKRLV
jgi:GNAT superfamily N-acetyltransferase